MSNTPRGKSPKAKKSAKPSTPQELRVAEAAAMLARSYIVRGSVAKRSAIQREAWRRFRDVVSIPVNKDREEKREKRRRQRAAQTRKEHPYQRAKIMEWFAEGFRKGLKLEGEK